MTYQSDPLLKVLIAKHPESVHTAVKALAFLRKTQPSLATPTQIPTTTAKWRKLLNVTNAPQHARIDYDNASVQRNVLRYLPLITELTAVQSREYRRYIRNDSYAPYSLCLKLKPPTQDYEVTIYRNAFGTPETVYLTLTTDFENVKMESPSDFLHKVYTNRGWLSNPNPAPISADHFSPMHLEYEIGVAPTHIHCLPTEPQWLWAAITARLTRQTIAFTHTISATDKRAALWEPSSTHLTFNEEPSQTDETNQANTTTDTPVDLDTLLDLLAPEQHPVPADADDGDPIDDVDTDDD
jgi:hypothetical protein